jgi:hypothetical protein
VVEDVAAEHALGQRHLTGSDRQVGLVRRAQLQRDLVSGVPAADDQDGALGKLGRVAVSGAVQLAHVGAERRREGRRARRLERAGRDDDLVGGVRPLAGVDHVGVVLAVTAA